MLMETILTIIGGIFAVIVGSYVLSLIGAAVACAFGYKPNEETDNKDMIIFAIIGLIVIALFIFFISLFV